MNRRERRAAAQRSQKAPIGEGSTTNSSQSANEPGVSDPAALCEAGRYLDAQLCCRQALAADANHADTLHLMGLCPSTPGNTSVAHLAGALGCPTWILLPYTPDYRWLLGRDDSPWYPSVRLFRQTETREFENVLERVRDELRERIVAFRPAEQPISPGT